MQPIADIRKEYKQETLNEKDIQPNAYAQFEKWWDEALKSGLDEVNAMTLATVNEDGTPAARIVLLKGYSPNGFVFYTNYKAVLGMILIGYLFHFIPDSVCEHIIKRQEKFMVILLVIP